MEFLFSNQNLSPIDSAYLSPNSLASLAALLLALIVYMIVYLAQTTQVPVIHTSNQHFSEFLRNNCPVLNLPYKPPFWAPGGRMQTILRQLIPAGFDAAFIREIMKTSDGGQFALDWMVPESCTADTPTIIILPGLTGYSESCYIKSIAKYLCDCSLRTVVFNYRSTAGVELLTPVTYSGTFTDDLELVITKVSTRFPNSLIGTVGTSLGGMISAQYLYKKAQANERSGIAVAMGISIVYDAVATSDSLEGLINWFVFNQILTQGLVKNVISYQELFRDQIDIEKVRKARTIREFDSAFTSRVQGYPSNVDYYVDANLHDKLSDIKTPLLLLSALDDPFSPGHAIPKNVPNNHVAIVTTAAGGHVAFLDSHLPVLPLFMDQVVGQYFVAAFNNMSQFQTLFQQQS